MGETSLQAAPALKPDETTTYYCEPWLGFEQTIRPPMIPSIFGFVVTAPSVSAAQGKMNPAGGAPSSRT